MWAIILSVDFRREAHESLLQMEVYICTVTERCQFFNRCASRRYPQVATGARNSPTPQCASTNVPRKSLSAGHGLNRHHAPCNLNGNIFPSVNVSHFFAAASKRVGIMDLRFHDLRHEATSRFFEDGLNPMQVSAITGHKTLQMLKRYTN